MRSRPYFRFLAQDLEVEFERNKSNLAIVRAVRAELNHRTRPRALRLRSRIDGYLVRVSASRQVPAARVVRLPALAPAVVRTSPAPMPKLLPAVPAPVASWPVTPPASPEKRSWTRGQRLGIAAVVLVLVGFFGYAALAGPKKADRAGTGTVNKAATMPATARAVSQGARAQDEATVYITRTGAKYHQAGCRYLSKSMIPAKLEDARKHHGPCSVCRPPQ